MNDYRTFNDNGEERTWEELYQDNVLLQQENQKLKGVIETYEILIKSNNINNWNKLKQYFIDYRFNKTGSHEDGRYCVAISVTDLLKKMKELEQLKGGDE